MKHFTTLLDVTPADLDEIFDVSADLKAKQRRGERPALLAGRVLALLFEKPSLRTRVSFEAAMAHLGGTTTFLTGKEAGLGGREALCDVARVLSRFADAIALRTFSQQLIEDFRGYATSPIINALSDDLHPCQALTDLFTLKEVFGDLAGRTLAYIGDGNNVARSLAIGTGMVGMSMVVAAPPGFELDRAFLSRLRRRVPATNLTQTTDPLAAVANADVVYTDVWASMGQEAEADRRRQIFAAYQVSAALLAHAPSGCRFMHDMPARRGEEVTDEVLDGPQSLAFEQAENRMHVAKGLLVWLLDGRAGA
ncbi:MAG TPA: ornithine carbamoyltransferase [Planctomycetaceae bacterium]|nr:ornithine carbamoyltransferase [Planctomycetaceae bacterium]